MGETHHTPHVLAPDRPERSRQHTHEVLLTTREKCVVETPYDAVVEVEDGKAVTVTVIDTMHAELVADDKPGRALVSVTPMPPHEDYVPAVIRCEVVYPVTSLSLSPPVPK